MLKIIAAYLRGMWEFRRGCTWVDPARPVSGRYTELDEAYDRGRDMAHRLTLRHWDD